MTQAISSGLGSLGNYASMLPSVLGSFMGGGGGAAAGQAAEGAVDAGASGLSGLPAAVPPTVPEDPGAVMGIGGAGGYTPAPTTTPDPIAAAMAGGGGGGPTDSFGGRMAGPYSPLAPDGTGGAGGGVGGGTNLFGPGGGSLFDSSGNPIASPLNASAPATGPMGVMGMNAGAASAAAAGDPADPSGFWSKMGSGLLNWLKGDLGAKGAFATPTSSLGTIGGVMEAINRWQNQARLQNPAALAAGAAKMYQPMSKALRRAVIGPVTAAAQETGQINAPGLYSQSVATALAPIQARMQMAALENYIRALQDSEYAYPQGGIMGSQGLVPQSTQGGSAIG